MARVIKLVLHESGKCVVNEPGSGKRPRVYTSLDKALARVTETATSKSK